MISTPTISDSNILIVDDSFENLMVISMILASNGYGVLKASSGEEALEIAADTHPDIVLLDVMMPGLNGFDTCEQLKALPHMKDVPVMFMTALDDMESKMTAFNRGAVDYLTKPIHRPELLARIRIHLRFRQSYKALVHEHINQLRSLKEAQTFMMPNSSDFPEAHFAAYYDAKHEAGGDFYDVIPAGRDVFDYIVADVSGHDLGASLPTAALRALLRQNASLAYSPEESLNLINEHLTATLQPGQYATLVYLRVDRKNRKAFIVNAAHTPVVHCSKEIKILNPKGHPVGCFEKFTPGFCEVDIASGDQFILFSDGIIEENNGAPCSRKEGMDSLIEGIQATRNLPAEVGLKTIISGLHPSSFIASDDLLLLRVDVP